MEKNSKTPALKNPSFSIIKKREKEEIKAGPEKLKKIDKKYKILLPPEQEKYIKIKKHDFR